MTMPHIESDDRPTFARSDARLYVLTMKMRSMETASGSESVFGVFTSLACSNYMEYSYIPILLLITIITIIIVVTCLFNDHY